MKLLKDIFLKPIDRPIEGVIKTNDNSSLHIEVDEYVLTQEVSRQLDKFVSAYNNYNATTENGVWISGFFGSGKSHLLKILAFLLENREIDGQPVANIFLPKCDDEIFRAELRKACNKPSKSILFNIDQKTDTISTKQTDALLSVFIKVFDEVCGYYGKQGYIAKFERDLDSRNLYGPFQKTYEQIAHKPWEKGREQAILEGPNIAKTYAAITGEPEEAANGIIDKYRRDYKVSINDFATEVKAYIDKQAPGFRLNFFVDEVGQYIADNVKLMLNLQSIAEALATVCQGQAWVIVTAQEDMTSVFGEFGKKQGNDFSKIQGRFVNRLKLTSANVDEVIKKRLLEKKPEYLPDLEKIYNEQQNNFKTLFGFSGGTKYKQYATAADFSACYPFVPYQFKLFQSAIQGLSEHNVFEGKHNSVGERSMLGVFQTVAVELSKGEIGTLASFDLMFEGIRQSVKSNAVQAIRTAEQQMDNDEAKRVLKALFLVKYYSRQFVASARNLSILLMGSFSENAVSRQKKVQEALNQLESESYIQRDGEVYEYLTDEEQDIEKEIKNTSIDNTDVSDELNRILFEEIIGGTKIRYTSNKQDYTLGKKMDDRNLGVEKELAIHIITPWYERNTGEIPLTNTWAKAELQVVMPPDDRFMADVTLLLKTKKYVKQNSSTANESVSRILDTKSKHICDREQNIKVRAELLLVEADLKINGNTLDESSTNPRQRIESACQELIQFSYPNLKMLGNNKYQEQDIATYFDPNCREMYPKTLSEAEMEVLNFIKLNHSNGLRTTVKTLRDKLNMRPYGWYDAAIFYLVARLATCGKLEIHSDGNLLDDQELITALKNSHRHDNITLEPQPDYTPAQVKRVKNFYNDYFQEPANASDPKQLGSDLLTHLHDLEKKVSEFEDARTRYPFLDELAAPLAKLKTVAEKSASYFFDDCPQSELETLCNDKEDYIDPIIAFMNSNGHTILDNAKKLLREQDSNLNYISHEETQEINDIVHDRQCFKENRMPRLKELTDLLAARIAEVVNAEHVKAADKIDELQETFRALPDFVKVDTAQQESLLVPFGTILENLKNQQLIAVIREQLRTFEEKTYKQQVEKLYTLTHPIKANGPADVPIKQVESIPMQKPHVNFSKPWLENDSDLDQYFTALANALNALKEKLREEIKNGKRIQL